MPSIYRKLAFLNLCKSPVVISQCLVKTADVVIIGTPMSGLRGMLNQLLV